LYQGATFFADFSSLVIQVALYGVPKPATENSNIQIFLGEAGRKNNFCYPPSARVPDDLVERAAQIDMT
jgi:hypothetical protein